MLRPSPTNGVGIRATSREMLSALVLFVALGSGALGVGCGGGTPHRASPSDHADGAATRLAARMAIPGTGVTLRPPRGAELLPLGPGLGVRELELTVMVAMAVGPEIAHQAFLRGLFLEGSDASTASVEVDGRPATLGRDLLRSESGALPRAWLITRTDDRSLAVLATYRDGSDATITATVLESLRSVEWDPHELLDAERAIGVAVGPIEELAVVRSTIGTVALTIDGAAFPPPPGEPLAFLLPLAEASPDTVDQAACAAMLGRTGVANSDVSAAEALTDSAAWGCEHTGVYAPPEGPSLHVYSAVLFLPPGPVLLAGMAPLEDKARWTDRFRAAARSLHHLRSLDPSHSASSSDGAGDDDAQ